MSKLLLLVALIVIRHDRPDARYVALGARYPAVGRVGRRMGDGTLIGDRWVLTAAHVARGLMSRSDSPTVRFLEKPYRVKDIYIDPRFIDGGPNDFGLIELADPVPGIVPLRLYRDSGEAGQVATLVGHGQTGTGNRSERHDDDKKRGATNRVERADSSFLVFRFDAPPKGTDLEGTPGAGDSGGPALLLVNGRAEVAGVSSLGEPGPGGPGTYGAMDYFGRVSTHLAWIDGVLAGKIQPEPRHSEATASVAIPASASGKRLEALWKLVQQGPGADIEGFARSNLSAARLAARPMADIVSQYRQILTRYHGGTIQQVLLDQPYHTDLAVTTGAGVLILGVEVEPSGDHRIIGILEGRP